MNFTPLSLDPTPIVFSSPEEIARKVGEHLVTVDARRKIYRVGDEYALKVLPLNNPASSRELGVLSELQSLVTQTQIFLHSPGYVLDRENNLVLVTDYVPKKFNQLEDTAAVNEHAYFELLIGLYYARLKCGFRHNDIHPGNILWKEEERLDELEFQFEGGFTMRLSDSEFEIKLIDYGKATTYLHPNAERTTINSDVRDLTYVFLNDRKKLFPHFRNFLQHIMSLFSKYQYPSYKRDNIKHVDAEARPEFIVELLKLYEKEYTFDSSQEQLTWRQQRFMKEFSKMKI